MVSAFCCGSSCWRDWWASPAASTRRRARRLPTVRDEPAGTLYNEGLGYLNAGKLKDAVDSFDEVDRQHPYSEWARKALIMSAFASYRRAKYDDTISTASRYLTLYPGSPDAAYAQYLIGSSYFKQIPDVTRDQDQTRKAIAAFQDIVTHYPDSEYVPDSQQKLIVARDQLAGKEMQIGRYYLEQRQYLAAINRFRTVVTDFQTTRHVEEALERLTEAYYSLGLNSRGADGGGRARPQLPGQQVVPGRLQASCKTGGLEPSENKGSWISRVFSGHKTG